MLRAQQVLNPAKKAPAIRAGATDKSFPVYRTIRGLSSPDAYRLAISAKEIGLILSA